ncbi:MAG: YncE family protein [Lishizhenia sp.]
MRLINILVLSLLVVACKKDDCPTPDNSNSALEKGFLVLNEGLFQQNNASLSFVNEDNLTFQNQLFLNRNGRLLGDTGNDMVAYQDKVYIVLNASNTLEVLDKTTLKVEQQISLHYQGSSTSPRAIDFHDNYAYVCAFDGYVYKINLSNYEIETRFAVGNNPEDVLVVNDRLFVSNSGGLNAPDYDSTVMIFDLNTHTIIDTVFVGANPGRMIADAEGDVYVIKRGDYAADPSSLVYLDAQNNYQTTDFNLPCTSFFVEGNVLYLGFYDYNTSTSSVATFDTETEGILNSNLITSSSLITLYALAVKNEMVYCMDARGFTNTGVIRVFNSSGNSVGEYEVGLNPNSIIFYD